MLISKDPYILEFKLLGLPKTTNSLSRLGFHAKGNAANHWKSLVIYATGKFQPSKPLIKAKLNLTRHSSMECDYDGLVSSFKHVIDGLVRGRIISDDKMSNIGIPEYRWVKEKPAHGFITIRIEEVKETAQA